MTTTHKLPRSEWYAEVVYELELLLDCTTSDAQGILDCQDFYMAQAWALGLDPRQTARYIDEKSTVNN